MGFSWLALVLTYAVHSAVWAGAAALVSRRRAASPAQRSSYFKLALFGPVLTTLVAVMPCRLARAPLAAGASQGFFVVERGRLATERCERAAALGSAAATGFGLLRFGALLVVLRRRLRSKRPVRDARLHERLERVRARSGAGRVVLSEASGVRSPFAVGRSEICLPLTFASELSDAELDNVLAHELAHLERADGLWFLAVGFVEVTLWPAPWTHWVARRFRASAELACDDRAVALTGDALGLARALVRVAEPRVSERTLAPTMVRSASLLRARVRRLTRRRRPRVTVGRRVRHLVALASFGVLGLALATAAVRVAAARPEAVAPVSPELAAASQRMLAALSREQTLELELTSARSEPGAETEGTPAAVHVLELEQSLRHTRATAQWLERSVAQR